MQNYVNVHIFGGQPVIAGTTAQCGTIDVGTVQILAFPVPTDALGGGITITQAYAHATGTIAAASAPQFDVVTLSSAGGTIIGTICAFGSVSYSGGVPKVGTISDAWVDNDGGDYFVAVVHKQTAALGVGSNSAWVSIGYQQGR